MPPFRSSRWRTGTPLEDAFELSIRRSGGAVPHGLLRAEVVVASWLPACPGG